MKKPFFSVIVTEHNSAEWMRKGLDSIADQSFRDFELIVICDRCTDNTAEIAKSYDVRVPEITVEEADFGRAGLSRNRGLEIARGKWVLWMDDDDWYLHEFAFEMLAAALKDEEDVDILAYGFIWKGVGYAYNSSVRLWPAIWNKCWRREFIGKHRFPDWEHSDDLGFAREMHPKARIIFWDQPFYYYNFMRPGSVSDKLEKGEYDDHELPPCYEQETEGYKTRLRNMRH